MRAFTLDHPRDAGAAQRDIKAPDAMYIAGGTDLMQLLKNNVVAPAHLVDLANVVTTDIAASDTRLHLDAGAKMNDVAGHPEVRQRWPMLSQALLLSASPQVRNMATVGGNLLQRTRCNYFRDPGFAACNKRNPGSGCGAIGGDHRDFAVFGTSEHCIALHPSDFAVALMALDATLELRATDDSTRTLPLSQFYRTPGDTPQHENNLRPGELITAISVPASPAAAHSIYLKVRDRTSFAFALVSAAVALAVQEGVVRDARVALGGVGTMPWRVPEVEAALRGQHVGDDLYQTAAEAIGKIPSADHGHFKIDLAQRLVKRALQTITA